MYESHWRLQNKISFPPRQKLNFSTQYIYIHIPHIHTTPRARVHPFKMRLSWRPRWKLHLVNEYLNILVCDSISKLYLVFMIYSFYHQYMWQYAYKVTEQSMFVFFFYTLLPSSLLPQASQFWHLFHFIMHTYNESQNAMCYMHTQQRTDIKKEGVRSFIGMEFL